MILRNFTRRFRRNLDMRIFLKFLWASQGLLENKICHVMNAMLGQIKLRKPFPYVKFQICNLMHF
jgi:hypothetical protein